MNDSGSGPAFVDTNVLVYAATSNDERSQIAQALVSRLTRSKEFRTSTQVMQEFIPVVTRKIDTPLTMEQALLFLDSWAEFPVASIDYPAIREAAELTARARISFWDSLIVVAARRSGAKRLFTEDLQHGQTILDVKVINPFRGARR